MKSQVTTYVSAYGVVLAGLGLLTHWVSPEIARPTLITGAVGGALCALWGILGLSGRRWRAWAGLTLALTTLALIPLQRSPVGCGQAMLNPFPHAVTADDDDAVGVGGIAHVGVPFRRETKPSFQTVKRVFCRDWRVILLLRRPQLESDSFR